MNIFRSVRGIESRSLAIAITGILVQNRATYKLYQAVVIFVFPKICVQNIVIGNNRVSGNIL